jgi:hypothetical protein
MLLLASHIGRALAVIEAVSQCGFVLRSELSRFGEKASLHKDFER